MIPELIGVLLLVLVTGAVFWTVRGCRGRGRHRPLYASSLTATGEGWCLNHRDPLWHAHREECPALRRNEAGQ